MESGYEKTEELFTEYPDVDTLICATDTMAVGAVNWLKENGYQIPRFRLPEWETVIWERS